MILNLSFIIVWSAMLYVWLRHRQNRMHELAGIKLTPFTMAVAPFLMGVFALLFTLPLPALLFFALSGANAPQTQGQVSTADRLARAGFLIVFALGALICATTSPQSILTVVLNLLLGFGAGQFAGQLLGTTD